MRRLKRSPKQPALRPSAVNLSSFTDSRRETSPGLTANLPSNNPFRNRAASPANSLPSPINSTFNQASIAPPERPLSRNPFIDQFDKRDATTVQVRQMSPERGPSAMTTRSSPKKPGLTGHAVELFVSRSLLRSISLKAVRADSPTFRITSRSMMDLQAQAHLRKACLLHIPIVPHDPKIILQSLQMAYWDIIHPDRRKKESLDHTSEEGLKDRIKTSLQIRQRLEDHTDGLPDGIRIHRSPASS